METRPDRQPTISLSIHTLIPSLFFAFRLVYIPASILSHSGHGLPWLTATAGLLATFGMEALVRRGRREGASPGHREIILVLLALLLLGFFPEEGPIGVILWAALGAAWGRLGQAASFPAGWLGLCLGGMLGVTGLFGPGSWLMALLLALWWRSDAFNKD